MKRSVTVIALMVFIVGMAFAGGQKEEEGYKMGGVVFFSDFFMQTVQAGMKEAADEAGVAITFAVSELDEAREARIIDDMITKGVDAILITPVSSDGSVAALRKAKQAGVKVICFNTTINEPGIVSAFLFTAGEAHGGRTGQEAAKYINQHMGGRVNLGILNCEVFELCVARYDGFLAELDKAGIDYNLVSNQQGYVADEAVSVAENILQAHPEIDMLWAENEGGTVGIVQAVKSMGLEDKVAVFGTDMNPQLAQMLLAKDGVLLGTTGQSPYDLGYNSVYAALDVLQGKTVPEIQHAPVLYFGRGDRDWVQEFLDKEGKLSAGASAR